MNCLRAENGINFFFAKDKLFKMYDEHPCEGELTNGISVGMNIDDAIKIDKQLSFDDWEEEWISPNGYWIESSLSNFSATDVSVLSKETGVEYAKVTIGNKAYLIRGDENGTDIPISIIEQIKKQKWSFRIP